MNTVSLVKGDRRALNIKQSLDLIHTDTESSLKEAKQIFIKVNLVHHLNQLASTHVDAVRGVLDYLRQHTDASVLVGDASYHGTKAAFTNFGYENLQDEYKNVTLVDLNDDETIPGFYIKKDGSKGEMGFSKMVSECDFTISLALPKTHRDTGVTLTVKNWAIGTWVVEALYGSAGKYWPRWPYLHDQGRWAHEMSIAKLLGQHTPSLSVVDGFTGMEGDGPTNGTAIDQQIALASCDALLLDIIACKLMNVNPSDIGHLVLAAEKGYGVSNISEVKVVGDVKISDVKKSFIKPNTWEKHVLNWKK